MRLRVITSGAAPERAREFGPAVPPAVLHALSVIHERYAEPLTVAELASEVYVSQFHFSRVFSGATGLTPGRFLTAVRLFEAKLLLTTSLRVADVVCGVGYSSVGTFTSRFTEAVGMTPTEYRTPRVDELLVAAAPRLTRLPPARLVDDADHAHTAARTGTGTLTARVRFAQDAGPAQVLVCLFAERFPQRGPVAFGSLAAARSGDHVTIRNVPRGRWTVLAITEHRLLAAGVQGPGGTGSAQVVVPAGGHAIVDVAVRPPRPTDAPVAFTLASSSHSNPANPAVRAA